MKPASFAYMAPETVEEVYEALHQHGDEGKVLAGGQSLGPLLNLRFATPRVLIDLDRVGELSSGIEERRVGLRVPAMTRQRLLETDPTVRRFAPLLAQALPYVAHRTIRNRGTLGGSLAHADPAAELPTVAVAANASILIGSRDGRRQIPAEDFFTGFFSTALDPGEIVLGVDFPAPAPRSGTGWVEFAPRLGDFAIVGVAARIELHDNGEVATASVVCAGVADVPWRAAAAEEVLVGRVPDAQVIGTAAEAAHASASPPSDTSGSAAYRKNLVGLLARDALAQAVRNAEEEL